VVEIGGWNISGSLLKTISGLPSGVSLSKIIGAKVLIQNDINHKYTDVEIASNGSLELDISENGFTLEIHERSQANWNGFISTTINRGWILLDVLP
ncbi:MAG: hypothetical protein U9N85_05905, partial [Bacteroidota bacterium]|nr:hypothetical protein [Bacteroidota bacterium]